MISSRKGLAGGLLLLLLIFGGFQDAHALPAFARKYGLRCSACHEAWPMLNYFGQKFKDNGYQLMNDRDAPIWQNPSYWPVTFRMMPNWHRESTNRVAIDTAAGDANSARIETPNHDSRFRPDRPRFPSPAERWRKTSLSTCSLLRMPLAHFTSKP